MNESGHAPINAPVKEPETRAVMFPVGSWRAANPNHPDYCADSVLAWQNNNTAVLMIADGISAGGRESAKAAGIIRYHVERACEFIADGDAPIKALGARIALAGFEISNLANQSQLPKEKQPGTAATVMVIRDRGNGTATVHAWQNGDTRLLMRDPTTHTITNMTPIHTMAEALITGAHMRAKDIRPQFFHQLTRSVGSKTPPEEVIINNVSPGTIFIACSDGLTENFKLHEINDLLISGLAPGEPGQSRQIDLQKAAKLMVESTRARMSSGGTKDDVGIALCGYFPKSGKITRA